MVTLLLDSAHLEVVLSVTEHALAFRRQNVVIDRAAITRVQLTDDAWTWLRGVPDPGTYVPVAVAMGSWKSSRGRDLVLIRRRRPSVVIDLDGHPEFQRVILTTSHGLALIQALHLESTAEPADVVALATGTIDVVEQPVKKKPRARRPKPAAAS